MFLSRIPRFCELLLSSLLAQYLQVRLVLYQLFGAAVKQADVWVTFFHGLSAELQHQAQDSVSSRMLGAEVNRQVGDIFLCRWIFVCSKQKRQHTK